MDYKLAGIVRLLNPHHEGVNRNEKALVDRGDPSGLILDIYALVSSLRRGGGSNPPEGHRSTRTRFFFFVVACGKRSSCNV